MIRTIPVALLSAALIVPIPSALAQTNDTDCDPAYPDFCIAPPPPDLDCSDLDDDQRNFTVLAPDPHHFDGDKDGIGCEPPATVRGRAERF